MPDQLFTLAKQTGEEVYLAIDSLLVKDSFALHEKIVDMEAYALFYDTRLNAYMDKSPYLIRIDQGCALLTMLNEKGVNDKALFLVSPLKLHQLAEHMQQFMFKKRYDDGEVLLRIYDPYVINDFEVLFPDRNEQETFFSGISVMLYTAPDRRKYTRTIDGVRHE